MVLLLVLLLNLNACSTYPVGQSQFIEAGQPDRVCVYMRGWVQVELGRPIGRRRCAGDPECLNALGKHYRLGGTEARHGPHNDIVG